MDGRVQWCTHLSDPGLQMCDCVSTATVKTADAQYHDGHRRTRLDCLPPVTKCADMDRLPIVCHTRVVSIKIMDFKEYMYRKCTERMQVV